MKNFYQNAINFLLSKGIDPFLITTIIAVLVLYSEKGNMKKWKSIPKYLRQYHITIIAICIFFILVGLLHFFFGVGKW